jgi:hypothetical protein
MRVLRLLVCLPPLRQVWAAIVRANVGSRPGG